PDRNSLTVKQWSSGPKVYFYVPSVEIVKSVPSSIAGYWRWIDEAARLSPAKLANRDGDCIFVGPYNWTVQTFIHLQSACVSCELTPSLPLEGIIIAHGDFLPSHLKPSDKQFIVEIKPDRLQQCLYANFVIVQNPHDPIRYGIQRFLIKSAVVNYWPQP